MRLRAKSAALLSAVLVSAVMAVISAAQPGKEKTPMIDKSTPILHVERVEPSLKFWTERFGFKKTIEVPEGDHIGFAAVSNGPVELMFQTYSGMRAQANASLAKAAEQGPGFIFMEVPDINAVIDAAKGAEIVEGLHETAYGAREIVVKEPGGHFVIFSQLPKQ